MVDVSAPPVVSLTRISLAGAIKALARPPTAATSSGPSIGATFVSFDFRGAATATAYSGQCSEFAVFTGSTCCAQIGSRTSITHGYFNSAAH